MDILLPRHCAVCGTKLIEGEECLCTECAMHMPLTYFWTMESNVMSDKLNLRIERKRTELDIRGLEPYSHAAALYFYVGDYEKISKALKYNADIPTGRYAAATLGRKLSSSPVFADVDLIVPVPLHWARRLSRGYNQAEVIASEMALHMGGCAVDTKLLERRRHTKTQTGVSVAHKAENVKGAFGVNMEHLRRLISEGKVHHILLVDDVFTTGSTISECHVELRSGLKDIFSAMHGAEQGTKEAASIKISAATLAYVGE